MKDFIKEFDITNGKNEFRKILKSLMVFLLIFAIILPCVLKEKIEIKAAAGEGKISYSIDYNNGNPEKWTFSNVSVGAVPSGYQGYSSISIMYPKKFKLNYNTPTGWNIYTSGNANVDYKSISINFSNENSTNIENFFSSSSTYFTLLATGDYPNSADAKVQVTLDTISTAQYIDNKGNPHWYKCVPNTVTWYQAFNRARDMEYKGLHGYLATITSIEEQYFIFNTISNSSGWLGGTKGDFKDENGKLHMISEFKTGKISEDISKYPYSSSDPNKKWYWYWADGPERGTVFYEGALYKSNNGEKGKMRDGVFSFFSNNDTFDKYKDNPIQLPILYSGEPNIAYENCLQFAQVSYTRRYASWNNLAADDPSVESFYVEFSGTASDLKSSSVFESPVYIPVPVKVSFDIQNSDYTSAISDQTIPNGDEATNPTVGVLVPGTIYPQYGGKKFTGWFTDSGATKPYDFTSKVTQDLTLYGGWKTIHTISASSGVHGSLDKIGNIEVEDGSSLTINMIPDTGYHPSEVIVDGSDIGQVMTYTFANITANHSIDVNFIANNIVVKVNKDGNPWQQSGKNLALHDVNKPAGSGNIALNANSDNTYSTSIVPNGTYDVFEGNKHTGKQVVVDNNSPSPEIINYYTFTSSAGVGGSITGTSSGAILLPGEQVTVLANAENHYSWNNWSLTGDGASFLSLVDLSNQTLSFKMPEGAVHASVAFTHKTWKINTFAGPNGSVSPDGETTMFDGTDLPITITPDTGYHVEKVLVDGFNLGKLYNYTFANITANGILQAEFTPNVVKVEVTKDGKIWGNSGKRIYLHLAGDENATPIELEVNSNNANGNGYITKTVPNGIYEIYDGDVDTGETVTVMNNNPDTVEVSLYVITTTAGKNGEIISKDSKLNPLEGKNRYNNLKFSENETGKDGNVSKTIKFSNNRLLKNISNEILILKGFSQSFDIVPGKGYYVDKVYVNGKYAGYETSYRFDNIQQSQTLEATFMSEKQDSDGDGVPDYLERIRGTDPYKAPVVRTTKTTTTATTMVTNSKKSKVKTGDTNKTLLMGIMFIGSLMVMVFGWCWKRKKRGR
ncbi:MAG: InlB B-repeat-containing protein [Lachnospiraceae bacterium]|nr:InlB B-repeat-containing protein [Lachnospiraceae bacterium]